MFKIYIDQGHNPQNPNAGSEGNGLREQDIVYNIGQELASLLRTNNNFDVRLSRPTPTTQLGNSNTTSLAARVRDANDWGADVFLSLHTNAAADPAASGSEVLVFRQPSAAATLGRGILGWLSRLTGLRDRGIVTRSGLYVLRKTAMPALIVELGFITSPVDSALMRDDGELFAEAVYNGILEYFGLL